MFHRQSDSALCTVSALLTVLGSCPAEADSSEPVQVTLDDLSGNSARIVSPVPLAPSALVKLELDDDILLGEVICCTPGPRGFSTALHLDCALASVSSVRALMRALFDAPAQRAPGTVPAPYAATRP